MKKNKSSQAILKQADQASQSKPEDSETQKPTATAPPSTSPPPTPTPKPAPAPPPAVDLYASPQDNFEACPGTVTAYVVNKSGAPLYANYINAYNNVSPVGTAPYKAALAQAGCQDGLAVAVQYNGQSYVVKPADIRKTQP